MRFSLSCPSCPIVSLGLLVAIPAGLLVAASAVPSAPASGAKPQDGAEQGREWAVHDPARPQPARVETAHGRAPSDAVVLFDGTDLSAWTSGDGPAKWAVRDGFFEVVPGSGGIRTREGFGSCQLHIEWMIPETNSCEGQKGCNSGVFFMERYELQILGSNPNETYVDGMAGSMYGQYPPLVNPCRPNGEWNTYDIVFHAPVFGSDGSLEKPGTMTVFFNGVLVQDHSVIQGATAHMAKAKYSAHEAALPIGLQDHGDPIRFRNIWLRPLK